MGGSGNLLRGRAGDPDSLRLRFQLMMAVLLSVCVVMAVWPDIRLRYIILAVCGSDPCVCGTDSGQNS